MKGYPSRSVRKTTVAQRARATHRGTAKHNDKMATQAVNAKRKGEAFTSIVTKQRKDKATPSSITKQRKGKATPSSITKQRKGKATPPRATEKRAERSQAVGSEVPVLRFLDPKIPFVKLSKDRQTAENLLDDVCPHIFVVSEDSMLQNMLYQVEIIEAHDDMTGTSLGVVTKGPDTVTTLDFWSPGPAILRVNHGGIWVNGKWKVEERPALKNLPEGSKVGLAVDSDRTLHLYVDGKHQYVLTSSIPSPCYFWFGLVRDTKIRALPVTSVP